MDFHPFPKLSSTDLRGKINKKMLNGFLEPGGIYHDKGKQN